MSTSGTYNFNDVQIDDIAREAYERCGIVSDKLDGLQIQSAETSLNFMLSQWGNRGLNLWTIEKVMMPLIQGQPSYPLPNATIDILEATIAQLTRLNTQGVASSSSGVAQNAFDGDPTTSCIQDSPNGFIAWTYPTSTIVWYVGVQSNVATNYSLYIEYYDGYNWNLAYDTGLESYEAGAQVFYVLPVAYSALAWRIREYGGATLNIQELYFSIPNTSRLITRFSREEYISIPNKTVQSIPSSYYIDRTKNPVLNLWPTPDSTYRYIIYNRQRYPQDIGKLINNVDTPQRFYEALVAGLAAKLALKFAMDRYDRLRIEAQEAYDVAARADTERVPMRIEVNTISFT